MATGTVPDERTERKRELEATKKELAEAMARYASAEAAAAEGDPDLHPALVDQRIRRTAMAAARKGLRAAYRSDRDTLACAKCGGPMRQAGRGESPVETVPGRVRVSMARHACEACRTTVCGRASGRRTSRVG